MVLGIGVWVFLEHHVFNLVLLIIIHFYDYSILWEYSGCFLKLTKNIDTVFFPHSSLNPDADHQV